MESLHISSEVGVSGEERDKPEISLTARMVE